MLRKGFDPFRAVPVLSLEERAESIAHCNDSVYVGTAQGNLIHIALGWAQCKSSEDLVDCASKRATVRLAQKKPVEQVCASGGFVAAIADGVASVIPGTLQGQPTVLGKDARSLCFHTGTDRERSPQPELCVSFRRKLVLYSLNAQTQTFEQRQEFPTADVAYAVAWHQSWICAGFKKEYTLYSDSSGLPREIKQLDGKVVPKIEVVNDNELLLLEQENIGRFYNLATQQNSAKRPVAWPRKVTCIGTAKNFVVGSVGGGQLDVFSVRDQKNVQTLSIEGAIVGVCAADGARSVVATEAALVCMDPLPTERQLQKLVIQGRIGDAMDLVNACYAPNDPLREKYLGYMHSLAGWALFRDLEFTQAFQHFLFCADFKTARLLGFWRKYLPASWDSAAMGGEPVPNDGAPDPCEIEDFIRAKVTERQAQEGKSGGESAVPVKIRLANDAMVSFLFKQREAMLAQERAPAESRRQAAPDPAKLLPAIDGALLKLLVELGGDSENDVRLQDLLKDGLRCDVDDLEAFLRQHRRIDVLAQNWRTQGKSDRALQELSAMLRDGGASNSPGVGLTKKQIVSEMAAALRSGASSAMGADLLRRYIPEILAADATAVLEVFTGGKSAKLPLPIDEVSQLLKGHPDLERSFLEQRVAVDEDMDAKFTGQLALIYLSEVEKEQRLGDVGLATSPTRQKLVKFLDEARNLDAHTLLPQVDVLKLHEEKVILCGREQLHMDALRVLVEVLNDLPRAETYCRIVMARRQRQHLKDRVPIFSQELPTWARPLVFGKRGAAAAESTESSAAAREAMLAVVHDVGGPRCLLLLLQVLVEASVGAEQRPGDYRKVAPEYKDAILSLLMGYAGHPDLPPDQVIGLLPASWSLESVSGYLTKAARICLHERRASMFEENLSSMAYLKTFNAWATERMRKVTITRDSCCFKCTRRFVDKDSVGKAFIAYPNETCVHLQCKEDLQVCPKTGRSFADNLSVYCNALSASGSSGEA